MSDIIEKIGYNNIQKLEENIIIFQERLLKNYQKYIPRHILQQYLPPERSIIVNDDPDLYPIELKLPEPPPLHTIDGFGLSAKDQVFQKQKMPTKLIDLINTSKDFYDVVEKLDQNRTLYKDEIRWIQQQWYYRLNGYWFWNNGVPTYIDGWHFYYCNYWYLDVGLPIFNYRDRIFFLFARYCYTTHEAPFFYRIQTAETEGNQEPKYWYFPDEDSAKIYKEIHENLFEIEQGFWLINYKHRTVYGFNYPKHRREGATYKGACIHTEIISRMREADGLLLSMDGDAAERTFTKKYKFPMRQMVFFFLPEIATSLSTQKGIIEFDIASYGDKKRNIANMGGLMSSMHPQTSGAELKSDGEKFMFIHGDETGKGNKNRPYNCLKRHDVVKKTIAQRPEIHGLILNTSTADDTRGDFGRNYKELCKKSHWHIRSYEEGVTESGLINLFIPAYVNLSKMMTDKYGYPLIENLSEEQKLETGEEFGAKLFIESQLARKMGDSDAYYHEIREFPTRFKHCFLSSTDEAQFDILEINERINKLDMMTTEPTRRGDFVWAKGWGSSVEFVPNSKGKFYISYYPSKPNNLIKVNGKLVAGNKDIFIAGCDPFRYDKTRKGRHSKGAGCVYMKRDFIIDPEDKPLSEWVSDRFVCTYTQSVPEEEYREDMLMMTIFYGCEMFPEMNEEMVYKYFRSTKYVGLLGYLYVDGKKKELPGVYTHNTNKPIGFKLWKIKIEKNIRHELHRDILQELSEIESLDDMRDYDLFAAGTCVLIAMYYSTDGLANAVNKATISGKDDSILKWILREQGLSVDEENYYND